MWKITNTNTIDGDKVVTPFGYVMFETVAFTDDSKLAEYFKNHIGFKVEEVVKA